MHGLVIMPRFQGIEHRAQAMFVQLTAATGRTTDTEPHFTVALPTTWPPPARCALKMSMNITEVQRVDWSFANGMVQHVPQG